MELQGLYESSQKERAELEAELQRCKAELGRLAGRKAQVRGHKGALSSHTTFQIHDSHHSDRGFGMCGLPWGKNVTSNKSLYCTHAENKQTLLTQQVGRDIINRMTP